MILLLSNNWDADIVDIETAFLYGDLDEEIYMKIPEGLTEFLQEDFDQDDCFVLDKAMYGLVQAARQYNKKFIGVMVKNLNFEKCLTMSGYVLLCLTFFFDLV